MIALGLDLSFRNTGYIFADLSNGFTLLEGGVIHNPQPSGTSGISKSFDQDYVSAVELYEGLVKLKERNPELIAAEFPTGAAMSNRASRTLGIATGIAVAVFHGENITPLIPSETVSVIPNFYSSKGINPKVRNQNYIKDRFPNYDWDQYLARELEHVVDATLALVAVLERGTKIDERRAQHGRA